MPQSRITVGTTPVLLANANSRRKAISVIFLSTAIEAGNTGIVFVKKGAPPDNSTGSPSHGDPLKSSEQITDQEAYPNDPSVFKGAWWAISDTAGQVVTVDEVTALDDITKS